MDLCYSSTHVGGLVQEKLELPLNSFLAQCFDIERVRLAEEGSHITTTNPRLEQLTLQVNGVPIPYALKVWGIKLNGVDSSEVRCRFSSIVDVQIHWDFVNLSSECTAAGSWLNAQRAFVDRVREKAATFFNGLSLAAVCKQGDLLEITDKEENPAKMQFVTDMKIMLLAKEGTYKFRLAPISTTRDALRAYNFESSGMKKHVETIGALVSPERLEISYSKIITVYLAADSNSSPVESESNEADAPSPVSFEEGDFPICGIQLCINQAPTSGAASYAAGGAGGEAPEEVSDFTIIVE